jgi:hypothetical protein
MAAFFDALYRFKSFRVIFSGTDKKFTKNFLDETYLYIFMHWLLEMIGRLTSRSTGEIWPNSDSRPHPAMHKVLKVKIWDLRSDLIPLTGCLILAFNWLIVSFTPSSDWLPHLASLWLVDSPVTHPVWPTRLLSDSGRQIGMMFGWNIMQINIWF